MHREQAPGAVGFFAPTDGGGLAEILARVWPELGPGPVPHPVDMGEAGEDFAAELRDFLAPNLARIKMPKLFDFRPELPREANGKLYKRELRDEYEARAKEQESA